MTKAKMSLRDLSTDDAIVTLVAAGGGDVARRDIARRLGQRIDLASSLLRLQRRGVIEMVSMPTPGRRPLAKVRLIGSTAVQQGAGFVRVGSKK